MLVNADFSKRAVVTPDQYQWLASPQAGVHRVMLDRVGAEIARATSIVRYDEGSHFPPHQHPGGEEILVLSGTFSDEGGDYPAGWYLRNPPGSSHSPASAPGATIFVKLFQMFADERAAVRINTRDPANWSRDSSRERCELFSSGVERTALERVPAGQLVLPLRCAGVELLVVEGELASDEIVYLPGSWLRMPAGDHANPRAGPAGATVYLKNGHLNSTQQSG